uniref:Adiponectin receptor 1 n=1 Tax=Microcebus murinus TaxID=30608 RepID=A0A8C5XY44_MICMU
KRSVGAQGNGAPARNRETDTVQLAELGPLLEEKGKRVITNPSKAEEEQTCPVPQEEQEEVRVLMLPLQAHHAVEKMEEFAYTVWEVCWRLIQYDVLPDWLKDSAHPLHGHTPPMPSFWARFMSIFCIYTETGNIWTHLFDFVLFLFLGILVMLSPNMYFMAPLPKKVVWGMFFLGVVPCFSFSCLFHTVYCHSEKPRLIYRSIISVLGISAITLSVTPKHRQRRAGGFLVLGLSGVVSTIHFATMVGRMGWFLLMAVMYITGAGLYACLFLGKFDIWFRSHHIFHVLVVAAAFVHFYGVSNLQEFHYGLEDSCTDSSLL